jgi:hypothetical protein
MKKCGGNPDVIVVYGHGGHNELIAPDGGYDYVTGQMFAEYLHEAGIRPRFVLFVCCFAYAVAKEAFDTWITLGNDGCYFVGPTIEEKAEAAFSSNSIPARFIHEYLLVSVHLLFH